MSSLTTIVKRKKIALFVGGLGSDGNFFNQTIQKLNSKAPTLTKVYREIIDMSDFSVTNKQFVGVSSGSLFPSSKALEAFNLKIAEVVNLANSNTNTTIMVKTKLDFRPDSVANGKIVYKSYESIDNQSIKLIKIIESIKQLDSSIEIILVGHSQGGLVNLKTATEIPNKIKNIVSISTPYSPVTTAYLLRTVEFVANIFYTSVYPYFSAGDYEEYEKRVKTLSDSKYLTDLKTKWNKLSKRPSLTVIAGISAHLMTSQYFTIFFVPFEINHRYPFDGLVMGREQVDIDHCDLHVLHNPEVECYEKSDGFTHSCCSQFGLINNHNCKCALPCLDISSAILKSGLSSLESMIKQGEVKLEELPVIKALIEGINGEACSNENYRQYYEVIGGNYSHKNIVIQNDTIGLILGVFTK